MLLQHENLAITTRQYAASENGRKCCDEVCVDTSSDDNNCGSCGRDCSLRKNLLPCCCVDLHKWRQLLKMWTEMSQDDLDKVCENGLYDYN